MFTLLNLIQFFTNALKYSYNGATTFSNYFVSYSLLSPYKRNSKYTFFILVLQSPVLNGEVHTEQPEESSVESSIGLEQSSTENNFAHTHDENSHIDSNSCDENHSR